MDYYLAAAQKTTTSAGLLNKMGILRPHAAALQRGS